MPLYDSFTYCFVSFWRHNAEACLCVCHRFPAKEALYKVKFVATRIVTRTRNTLLYAESLLKGNHFLVFLCDEVLFFWISSCLRYCFSAFLLSCISRFFTFPVLLAFVLLCQLFLAFTAFPLILCFCFFTFGFFSVVLFVSFFGFSAFLDVRCDINDLKLYVPFMLPCFVLHICFGFIVFFVCYCIVLPFALLNVFLFLMFFLFCFCLLVLFLRVTSLLFLNLFSAFPLFFLPASLLVLLLCFACFACFSCVFAFLAFLPFCFAVSAFVLRMVGCKEYQGKTPWGEALRRPSILKLSHNSPCCSCLVATNPE